MKGQRVGDLTTNIPLTIDVSMINMLYLTSALQNVIYSICSPAT